jgi:hypothetical protein
MMDGLARIVDGVTNKANKGWVRGFTIGVGVLAVIISIMILAAPVFGAVFCWPHYSNGSTNNRYTNGSGWGIQEKGIPSTIINI